MKIKTIKTIIALLVLCIIAVMLATGCTFILNGSGQIIHKNVGMMTGTQLEGAIEDLL